MNSYGLVFGGEKTSHDSGNDIAYNVVSGNDYTQVVIEGDEYILPKEAMQSDKVYDFVDKLPIEMLDEIKRSANVFVQFPTLRQGDMVVCKIRCETMICIRLAERQKKYQITCRVCQRVECTLKAVM